MAKFVGFPSMDALVDATVPADIRRSGEMDMGKWSQPLSESEFLATMKGMADKNKVFKSYQAGNVTRKVRCVRRVRPCGFLFCFVFN